MADYAAVAGAIGLLASLFLLFMVANYGAPGRRAVGVLFLSLFGLASLALFIHAAVAIMHGST